MKIRFLVVVLLVLASSMGVQARPVAGSLEVNTLGMGGDLTVNMGRFLNGRVGVNYFRYDVTVHLNEADVDGTLRWLTVPLLLDFHPAGGGFRISFGGMINQNEVTLSADPIEPLELQGTDYNVESLDGLIDFMKFSPYLGIGYGNAVADNSRVHFACDFGLMYHGSPQVSARATANLPGDLEAQLNEDLQAEVDDFEKDAKGFVIYPVVSLGFSVAF